MNKHSQDFNSYRCDSDEDSNKSNNEQPYQQHRNNQSSANQVRIQPYSDDSMPPLEDITNISNAQSNVSSLTMTSMIKASVLTSDNYVAEWKERISFEENHDKAEESLKAEVKLLDFDDIAQTLLFENTFSTEDKAQHFINKMRKIKKMAAILEPESDDSTFYGRQLRVSNSFKENIFSDYIVKVTFNPNQYADLKRNIKLETGQKWRLEEDKLDFYDQMRGNLTKLDKDDHKRGLVVNLRAPEFNDNDDLAHDYQEGLNEDQIDAVRKALQTQDYSLILGMPGTGKTHVIVLLLRILIARGERIILSSYTHFAVDNILLRFVEKYDDCKHLVLRFGNVDQVEEGVKEFVYNKERLDKGEEAHKIFENKKIFAVTCLGAANKLLQDVDFDICIIDEASQIVEPVALGPILLAKKFIMIGDHNQLPPLIRSENAKKAGMDVSLFERLLIHHKQAVSALTIQYRMNKDIMQFSNKVIYRDNPMKCANDEVANGKLTIPKRIKYPENLSWVSRISDPDIPVACFDLGEIRQLTYENSTNMNCLLTLFAVKNLLANEVNCEDIGVITPLNDDMNQIKDRLKKQGVKSYTIDKCQGIDKKCIIINFSLDRNRTRGLLADRRRVNVAFTRAKHKMLLIGSYNDLKTMEAIGDFVKKINKENKFLIDKKQMDHVIAEVGKK